MHDDGVARELPSEVRSVEILQSNGERICCREDTFFAFCLFEPSFFITIAPKPLSNIKPCIKVDNHGYKKYSNTWF